MAGAACVSQVSVLVYRIKHIKSAKPGTMSVTISTIGVQRIAECVYSSRKLA
jgi:hypothetical protein